ncbi:uncharacterized protein LOC110293958 [Mus caroli]|uniref:Uncharacterized protein LOC110293958 n=1 Tax=Mus caroli TaxID=10089 RepID=A0A6P5PQR7_MUSCR|nr:uncharacterized protein LOC110293958 [Mus caroli]
MGTAYTHRQPKARLRMDHVTRWLPVVPGSLREKIQKMERVEASKDKTHKRHRRRVLGTTGGRAERTSGEHVKERHRTSTWRRRQREGGWGKHAEERTWGERVEERILGEQVEERTWGEQVEKRPLGEHVERTWGERVESKKDKSKAEGASMSELCAKRMRRMETCS